MSRAGHTAYERHWVVKLVTAGAAALTTAVTRSIKTLYGDKLIDGGVARELFRRASAHPNMALDDGSE